MSGFFTVTPEAAWSAVICLGLLALLALSPPGKHFLKALRPSAPRLLLCFMCSLVLVFLGWFEFMANMEVREPGWGARIVMSALLPGIYLGEFLGPNASRFTGVPFVTAISSLTWTSLLYVVWTGVSRWRAVHAAA